MLFGLAVLFLVGSVLLWVSVFAYPFVLVSLAPHRREKVNRRTSATLPEIAIVIPTLNEDRLILSKLRDLKRSDYPLDRMTTIIVDGGSEDRTTSLIEQETLQDASIRLVHFTGSRGQADQVDHVLRTLTQEIVVVTDADAQLDPACIRELVIFLLHDPETAVVGANVQPDTNLYEEQLHWRLVNYLWWLEGEVLSSGAVSGVCYAIRRSALQGLTSKGGAQDMFLTVSVRASGFAVRSCPAALATELRAPRTLKDFVRFRHRRGSGYASALRGFVKQNGLGRALGLANVMRLWHFVVTPKLTVTLVALGFLLLWTSYLYWPMVVLLIFALSVAAAGLVLGILPGDGPLRATLGFVRALGLDLFAMITLGHEYPSDSPLMEDE